MIRRPRVILAVLVLVGCAASSCQQSSPPTPATSAPQAAATPSSPPPLPPAQPVEEDNSLVFMPLDSGKFSMEAIQSNKQRVAANPNDAVALAQLGHANYMIQRYPTAKDYYERAVHADGKLLEARLGLSNCDALLGQVDEALKEVTALLAVDRNHPEALYNQGMLLLYGKHDRAGAKQAWERLVSSHPDSDLSQRATARLRRL
jgi:tetratricopeptide (TPR) repeat protein